MFKPRGNRQVKQWCGSLPAEAAFLKPGIKENVSNRKPLNVKLKKISNEKETGKNEALFPGNPVEKWILEIEIIS